MNDKMRRLGNKLKDVVGIEGDFKTFIKPMIGYNSANIFFGGAGYPLGLYYLTYLTEVENLSTKQAGLVSSFSVIWDAITDPIMGIIADRTRSKHGKHRRYLLWGVIPVAISYFLLWNSLGISDTGSSFNVMLYYIAVRILYSTVCTMVGVPHTAMLPEIAPGYFERTQYKMVEYIFNSVGQISSFLLVAITLGFFNMDRPTEAQRGTYMALGTVLCIYFALPLLYSFKHTHQPSSLNMPLPELNIKYSLNEYLQVFKNKAFREYFIFSTCYMMAKGFYANADQYFILYQAKRWDKFNVLTSLSGVAEASASPLNYMLVKKFGKQFSGKLLGPVMFLGIILNYFVSASTPFWVVVAIAMIYNFGFSGPGFVISNAYPDVTDVDELITGRRREGVIATFSSFLKKIVSGAMSSFVGLLLHSFGFKTGRDPITGLYADIQTPRALKGLNITFIILPAIFTVLTLIFILRYKMTKIDHELIKRVIQEKKETGNVNVTEEEKVKLENIAGRRWDQMWAGSYAAVNSNQ